jgi:hypothetical protein
MNRRKSWPLNPSEYFREEKKNKKTYSVQILLFISNSEPNMFYFTTKLKKHSGIEIRINTANTTA